MAGTLEDNSQSSKQKHNLPKNSTGKKFIDILASEINNVVNRESNFEKVIVYMSTILQKSKYIKKLKM